MAKRRGRPKGSENAPKGRKRAGFDPESLVALVDVTPKIHVKTKRLSLSDAKKFHAHLGKLIAKLEGKKK